MPIAAPVSASNTSALNYTYVSPNIWGGGDSQWVEFHLNNPSSNSYAVTAFTITAPTGWAIIDCDWISSPLTTTSSAGNSCTWSVSSGTGLTPGASAWLEMEVTFAATTGSQTYPLSGVFTSKVQDASSAAFYNGPSMTLTSIATDTELLMTPDSGTIFTAGSPAVKLQTTLNHAYTGLAITWIADTTGTFSSTTTNTNSTGGSKNNFSPSNFVSQSPTTAWAYLGNPWSSPTALCDSECWTSDSNVVTTVPGAPSSVTFTYNANNLNTTMPHYETNHNAPANGGTGNDNAYTAAGQLAVHAADKFSNTVAYAGLSGLVISVAATSAKGVFDDAGTNASSIACTDAAIDCTTGLINVDYYQSGVYGSAGVLQATMSGTVISSGKAFSAGGRSGSVITSTFQSSASLAPTVTGTSATTEVAGGSSSLTYRLETVHQVGVPVAFYAFNDSAANYVGSFTTTNVVDTTSGGGIFANTTVATNATSYSNTKFRVDTTHGMMVSFDVCVLQKTDTGTNFYCGANTADVTTLPGSPSKFQIVTEYGFPHFGYPDNDYVVGGPDELANPGNAVIGGNVSVDVQITDAFGNLAVNPGGQIQLQLSTTCGSSCPLSATAVYISSLSDDTFNFPSFGAINWFMPGSATSGITLTATGVLSGHTISATQKVNVVSKVPVAAATCTSCSATVSGTAYSGNSAVTFSVSANASAGYGNIVPIDTVGYKVDSGTWQSIDTSGLASSNVTEPVTVGLTDGAHTISFNATDAVGNVSPAGTFHIVVDTSNPTVHFVTANNANLTAGSTVSATIVDTEGELNATGVTAVANGNRTLTVHIATSNNPGNSVTYQVTISGLAAGTSDIVLTAPDYAGNSGSSSVTVHVSVPQGQTFTGPNPTLVTQGGFQYVNSTFTNNGVGTQTAQVWFELKNGAGQVVFLTANQQSVHSGSSVSVLFGIPSGLAAGAYTAETFVYVGGQSFSPLETVTVTVA